MKIQERIGLIIIGILLAICGWTIYKNIRFNEREKQYLSKIEELSHPPTTTAIRHDSIIYKDSIRYKPYPVKVTIIDSIPYPVYGTISFYDSIIRRDGIRFRWRSTVLGQIDTISFSDFVFPKEIVEITKWNDTCYSKPPKYIPKNHWGLYTELIASDLKLFPGIGVGLHASIKDRFTVATGAIYMNNQLYGNLRIGVILK